MQLAPEFDTSKRRNAAGSPIISLLRPERVDERPLKIYGPRIQVDLGRLARRPAGRREVVVVDIRRLKIVEPFLQDLLRQQGDDA